MVIHNIIIMSVFTFCVLFRRLRFSILATMLLLWQEVRKNLLRNTKKTFVPIVYFFLCPCEDMTAKLGDINFEMLKYYLGLLSLSLL